MEFYGTTLLSYKGKVVYGLIPKSLSLYDLFAESVRLKEDLIGSSSVTKSLYGERSRNELAYRYTIEGTWPVYMFDYPELISEANSVVGGMTVGWVSQPQLKAERWTNEMSSLFPYALVIHRRITGNISQLSLSFPLFNAKKPYRFRVYDIFVRQKGAWLPSQGLGTDQPPKGQSTALSEYSYSPDFPKTELGFPQFRTVLEILGQSQRYQSAVLKQNSSTNAKVAQNAKALSINGLAFVGDILGLKSTLKQIVGLGQRLSSISNRSIRDIARITSDAQLIDSYVVKTTVSDVASIIAAARRMYAYYQKNGLDRIYTSRAVTHTSHSDILEGWSVDITISEKVRYDSWDQATLPFMRLLQSLDFFPSFTNVWDLIPFSFVIDWIYPIQEIMEEMDTDTYVSNLPIREVLYSRHTRLSRSNWPSEEGIRNVSVSSYQRAIRPALADGSPYLPAPKDVSLSHIPEATALLIQQGTRLDL